MTTSPRPTLDIVLITGMSGSGKSVALTALEDIGFYCVDNLPPELLEHFIGLEQVQRAGRVAIAIDARSAASLPGLPQRFAQLQNAPQHPISLTTVFLDATTETLVRRFSETRRLHPLSLHTASHAQHALAQAINNERELLAELRECALVFDTSLLRPGQLRSQMKDLLCTTRPALTLVFESFAFKRGIPMDADFVFDVRMLPNPHYDPALKALNGRDAAVAAYLAAQPEVLRMQTQITTLLRDWLDQMLREHRSYVTVAIGCTGGQHRSVYLVEQLGQAFASDWAAQVRHREQPHWPSAAL